MRCGEAYGSLPPPPSEFLKNTNPLYVQTGSREAGCLVRGGPLRRGRGEAAGDCVDGEEPFHTAAVERTVARAFAASTNSLYCRRRGWRPRPGSVGKNSNREVKRRWRKSSRGKVHRPTAGSRSDVEGRASVKRGGRRDRRQLFLGQEIGRRDPPVPSAASASKNSCLTLGQSSTMPRPAMTRDLRSSRSELQGRIMTIFATDAPRGDCEAPEGGFSQRFPPSRGGLRPFASPPSHRTNRRWAASAAAAHPRIATAGGAVNS